MADLVVKHPTKPGWIINTIEIQQLQLQPLLGPEGQLIDPLILVEPDFDTDQEAADYVADQQEKAVLLAQIKTTAQSAVGTALNDLTQAQIKALLAILLWQAGAVDNSGEIRALGEWVRD